MGLERATETEYLLMEEQKVHLLESDLIIEYFG